MIFRLFYIFFKIGAFTLGGGLAMLTIIEREIVKKWSWISEKEFWELITIIQILPGVFAVNMALSLGYKLRGWRGALAAVAGAILPSIIIMIFIAAFFGAVKENAIVTAIFKGIRPAVAALIICAAVTLWRNGNKSPKNAILLLAVALLTVIFKISPARIILAAIALGFIHAFIVKKNIIKNRKQ